MAAPDKWISDYDAVVKLADSCMQDIQERNRDLAAGKDAGRLTTQIRRKMNNISTEIGTLTDQLAKARQSLTISDKEGVRRSDLINRLKTRKEDLASLLKAGNPTTQERRGELMGKDSSGRPIVKAQETEETEGLANAELLGLQKQVIKKQDESLDQLSEIIARHKQIGTAISTELDEQARLLDGLEEGVDRTSTRVKGASKAVDKLRIKSKTGGMLCCIFLLLAIIITLVVSDWGCLFMHSQSYCQSQKN